MTVVRIGPYDAWLFDCDGVILDSNSVKTDAFYELARPFGTEVAEAFSAYHRAQGGVSRFVKVKYLYERLLGVSDEGRIREGLEEFARLVRAGLETCGEAEGLRGFLESIPSGTYRAVISGGLEEEVRSVLATRGLARYFGDVFGSPRTKDAIFSQLKESGKLGGRAVYFGDARYDHEVATRFGVDFVFVSGMTEFQGWESYFGSLPVLSVKNLRSLEPR